jgi:hypothetical protein
MSAMSGIWPPQDGHPQARKLSGPAPGLFDRTQPRRVLRQANSQLNFASFDPQTAAPHMSLPNLANLTLKDELYRPKRIVIETSPSGQSTWRFVPKAQFEPGVENEGTWPRVIDYCEYVEYFCLWLGRM